MDRHFVSLNLDPASRAGDDGGKSSGGALGLRARRRPKGAGLQSSSHALAADGQGRPSLLSASPYVAHEQT